MLVVDADDESRCTFGSSLRPHLNVGAMSHNCRTADHLMWLKSILALGFRCARAPRRRGWLDNRPLQLGTVSLVTELTVTKLKPDRPLTV